MIPLENRILQRIREILGSAEGCHDLDHTLRVFENARAILKGECPGGDEKLEQTVRLAALLHDCARPEEQASCGKVRHEQAGCSKAERLLREEGCRDEEQIRAVLLCIRRHRYRGADRPVSQAEKIVYDADKLDSIGAVGIGRAFHFAGHTGARLHNTAEEALSHEEYSREDTAYREYLVKLRHVPEKMQTATGRAMAASRASFMDAFFQELARETAARPETANNP